MEGSAMPTISKQSRSVSVESNGNSSLLEDTISDLGQPNKKYQKVDYFPASRLFEYQWPLSNSEGIDFYILQEQVIDFLDIRGIQRKYPDLYRRSVDIDERKYLMGRGVVTEMQSNMGLVALKSEEVLELMVEDYPSKMAEYQLVLQEREFQATLHNKMMEAKSVALLEESREVARSSDFNQVAMKDVISFNTKLAEFRRKLSVNYIDKQTKLLQVPRAPPVVCPAPKLSRYPVAVLPGQFSDDVMHYSSQELNRLPLMTVMDLSGLESVKEPVVSEAAETLDVVSLLTNTASSSVLKSLFSTPFSNTSTTSGSISSTNPEHVPMGLVPKGEISVSKPILSGALSKPTIQSPIPKLNSSDTSIGNVDEISKESECDAKQIDLSESGTKDASNLNDKVEIGISNSKEVKKPSIFADGNAATVVGNTDAVSDDLVSSSPPSSPPQFSLSLSPSSSPPPSKTAAGGDGEGLIGTHSHVSPANTSKSALCIVCFKGRTCNKSGHPEVMVSCSTCARSVHPSCYHLGPPTVKMVSCYSWQCLDCKRCQLCSDAGQDDMMMCCDLCDRGYHSYCVGLVEIPCGQWWCKECGSCASCGDGSILEVGVVNDEKILSAKWCHEFYRGVFIQTLCRDCSSYYNRGYFCPVCLKVYHNDESDSPMVCCDSCDRWIHTDCDGISGERYSELSKEEQLIYTCSICQGKVPDRVDKHHKRNHAGTAT